MKNRKEIKIDLLPIDFSSSNFWNSSDCPLSRAIRRYFKKDYTATLFYIWNKEIQLYTVKEGFTHQDYIYVKEQYEKNPKAKKTIYQVTLIPV